MYRIRGMAADRITISLDGELGRAVREAAERRGLSVSGWLSEAAADRLRNELLGIALGHWVAETGAPTDEEMQWAAEALGLSHVGEPSVEAA
jgi:hypothetical protein